MPSHRRLAALVGDRRGIAALEYALLAAMIGGFVIAAALNLGGNISGSFNAIGGTLNAVAGAINGPTASTSGGGGGGGGGGDGDH
jgi:Flp pilus assembly pilin Flp